MGVPTAASKAYYFSYKILDETYKATDEDINSFKIMTGIFVNSDLSEDTAYEFVKLALKNVGDYRQAHVVYVDINPERAVKTSALVNKDISRVIPIK